MPQAVSSFFFCCLIYINEYQWQQIAVNLVSIYVFLHSGLEELLALLEKMNALVHTTNVIVRTTHIKVGEKNGRRHVKSATRSRFLNIIALKGQKLNIKKQAQKSRWWLQRCCRNWSQVPTFRNKLLACVMNSFGAVVK